MYSEQNIRVDPRNEYILILNDGRKKKVSEIMIIDFAQRFCESRCWEITQAIKDIKACGHHVIKVFKKERKPDWFKTQRKATPEERRGYVLCGWTSKHFTEVYENRWNHEQLTREEYYERFGTLDIIWVRIPHALIMREVNKMKEIKFDTKIDMEKYIINNRDVLYLVVDWQHLQVLTKED